MNVFKYIILLFFYQSLFSQNAFVLKASVASKHEGNIVYYYYNKNANQVIADSTIIKNGKFIIKGDIAYPTKFNIYKNSGDVLEKNYSFFFGPGQIELNLNFSNFSFSRINQNKYQEEFLRYNDLIGTIKQKFKENREEREKIEIANSTIEKQKANDNVIAKLDSIRQNLELEYILKDVEYAKNNPSSYIALDNLSFDLGRSIGRKNYKEIRFVYNLMSKDVRNSTLGVFISEKLYSLERSTIGGLAIDFTSEDFFGNKFSLSDFLGKKVIMLDFWASWCAPCKLQHPFFRKIYKKYKDSGLELISISRDVKIDTWRETVEKENMEWLNTIVAKETKKAFDSYMIQAIPLIIVIDKNGKIIGRWTGYDEQYNIEIEKMISENLK